MGALKPKTYGDIVVNKLIGVNANIETSEPLVAGSVVFSINGGDSFAAVTKENETTTISNANATFGVLVDGVSKASISDVLICGEVMLENISAELKHALFKQKIVLR